MNLRWRGVARRGSATALNRRDVIAAGFGFGVVAAISGFVPRSAEAATEAGAAGALHFVTTFTDRAMAVMANRALTEDQRARMFRDVFTASFDLPAIGRLVLGHHWYAASADQRVQFQKLFERQQVLIFAGRFRYISGEKLTIMTAGIGRDGGWWVPSRVERAYGRPIPVDWEVAESIGDWRVTGMAIDGASMAFVLREDFGAVIQSNGGNFDALLTAMQRKIDQLSVG